MAEINRIMALAQRLENVREALTGDGAQRPETYAEYAADVRKRLPDVEKALQEVRAYLAENETEERGATS